MDPTTEGQARDDGQAGWTTPAFITRDQFVYYVTLAREQGDPADWPAFRV